MTAADRDAATRRQRAQTIALWRWSLIEPAMDDALTSRQRGQIVRELAAGEHAGPSGRMVSMSRKTIDRWITARRAGGFDALVPSPRQCAPRTDAQVVELAVGLKKENAGCLSPCAVGPHKPDGCAGEVRLRYRPKSQICRTVGFWSCEPDRGQHGIVRS
jgi:hypothetical protein